MRDRQLIFVSATAKAQCLNEARKQSPELVELQAGTGSVAGTIEHVFLRCDERDKPDAVRRAIRATEPPRAIVFTHRNERSDEVCEKLAFHKIDAVALHAEYGKVQRQNALRAFRRGEARVLVASDVAARGLDVEDVTLVINCDAPSQSNDYMHRAGRTGRAGRRGCALTLVTEREKHLVKRYESDLRIRLQAGELKDGALLVRGDAGVSGQA